MEPFTVAAGSVFYLGKWYVPETVPDAVVDEMVTFLERWEARNG